MNSALLCHVYSIISLSPPSVHPSIPPPHHLGFLKSSSSCPNMLCSAPVGLTRQRSRGTRRLSCQSVSSSSILPPLLSVSPHFLFFLYSALFPAPVSSSLSAPCGPDVWGVFTSAPRPRALSVIAVRPELDSLYRKMNEQSGGEGPGTVCDQPLLNCISGSDQPFFTWVHNELRTSSPLCMCLCLYHTDFPSSRGKTRFTISPEAHGQPSLPCYSQLSHHAFQQYQLGSISESLKSDSGLAAGGTSWDAENLAPPLGCYSGSPGHQGSSQTGRSEK